MPKHVKHIAVKIMRGLRSRTPGGKAMGKGVKGSAPGPVALRGKTRAARKK